MRKLRLLVDGIGRVEPLAQRRRLTSDEHFTVAEALAEAWASNKSFRPNNDDSDSGGSGRHPSADSHGEKRSNLTHESTADPESWPYRKSNRATAKLSYMPHLLTENRNGLIGEVELTAATGTAEREAARVMLKRASVGKGACRPGL